MASELLESWLAYYDPIHRGWTAAGIANGVCATNGYFFPRIRGGYLLRRTLDGSSESELVGAAGADGAIVRTFPWVQHEVSAGYTYRLTAVNGGGRENLLEYPECPARFDDQGTWIGPRPNAPSDLRVEPSAGGRFVLRWVYEPDGQEVEPAEFRVYGGIGWSDVDEEHPAAIVPARPNRLYFEWVSGPYDDGARVVWLVRAASASGVEEDNGQTAFGWADAAPPAAKPSVTISLE